MPSHADDLAEHTLAARAERWAKDDPDPHTQAEIRALLAHAAKGGESAAREHLDLADRFAGALEFGTAGLRGVIGGGPNRMNRAVVARTTWGLAQHLLASVRDAAKRGVVVGYDGRKMSREFAEDTAAVLAAAGVRAILSTEPIPTPLCAFAVQNLNAAGGVMITASHNPPEYNGYKVYWENAAQIIPPVDVAIAKRIDAAPAANKIPRPSLDEARAKRHLDDLSPAVERAYLDAVLALSVHPKEGERQITIVYTPLHGVGDKVARLAFGEAGFRSVSSVPEQQKPDGAFPTVAFPNPEEKGAMDLSFALARRIKADLVLANDPDADRLAVAVPLRTSPTGYFQLTGNQVGILLGHYLLTEKPAKGPRCVLASIVSSPLLGHIANKLGVHYEETLTGFKWIANRAMELEREQKLEFVFGYEEALGYTVGDVVRDKDGISAAVMMSELCAVLRTRGRGLLEELEAIHRTYGLFVSSQVNVTKKGAAGLEEIRAIMNGLRAAPPRKIGAHDVVAVSDYEAASRTTLASGEVSKLTLPKSNVLAFDLAGGSRIIARPSGTEPKVKFYFDVREPVAEGEALAAAETRATGMMKALSEAFVAIAMPTA
jgi:phosphomannomutase